MDFKDAEFRYRALEQKWAAGQIDASTYRKELGHLRVVDAAGEVWLLQEHTYRWYVFRGGQWVEGQRPFGAVVPQTARKVPDTDAKKRKFPVLLAFGILGLCLVCGVVAAGGVMAATGNLSLPAQLTGLFEPKEGQPTVQPEEPAAKEQSGADAVVKPAETIAVIADGTVHTDTHGVALTAPAGVVEEGGRINLSSNDLDAPWRAAVEQAVTIDTPFYSLAAQGQNDTPGALVLSFPASSPESRVLAVIDNEYLVELAQPPEDGRLTLQTRAGPADTTGLLPPAGYDGTGSIYYTVITPKSTTLQPSASQMVSWQPASVDPGMQADERNCIPDLSLIGGAAVNLCRQNPSGTVQVMLPTTKRDLLPQVDLMVDKIETVMGKYYELGFTTAQLSRSSPMLVRVSTKVSSPSYYPLNGVLYIPVDTVERVATLTPTDLYHEMAHWIQAVKYSTRLAYWSGEKTWWLETAAENMVMLVEPSYVGGNLTTYGTISNEDNSLVFQSSPYQWPGDYYIQAQLVKLNLCDSPACPLSTASFAQAISEGRYPLMDGAKKALVSANLKDYAYYLLGKMPTAANTNVPLSGPVKTGEGYGEYVRVSRTANTDLKFDYNGTEPQMRKDNQAGKEAVVIEARLERDGVYPLMVQGGQGNNPGLPVEMIIEAGAPFYYTLDDGPFQYSDGSGELKLLPIHGTMGIKKVRIVALGQNGGEVFKARVQPVDLQGAWVVTVAGPKTAGAMTCSGGSGDTEDPDGSAYLMAYMTSLVGGTGDMLSEPAGRGLDWSQVTERVPAELTESRVTYQAAALLAGDAVKYQASLDIPKADDSASLPPVLPAVSAAAVLPVLWLGRRRLNPRFVRLITNGLVIAFVVLVSTGCFGMGMYGSSAVDASFKKLEYLGGEDTGVLVVSNQMAGPSGTPIWKLTGSGTYDVSFYIETVVTDMDGNDTTEVTTCTGTVTFPVTASIYKDFAVQFPDED